MSAARNFGGSSRRGVDTKSYDPLLNEDPDADDNESVAYSIDEEILLAKEQPRKRRCSWFKCGTILGIVIIIILLILNLLYMIARRAMGSDDKDPVDVFVNWGKPGTGTEDLAWYPTDFSRDVIPKSCHSHNDYWRRVPLFSALRAGCTGVEADVWWYDENRHRDHLYVGHTAASLTTNRTFESLYINPLVEILERQNPSTEFWNGTSRGVFDVEERQTLTLLVDVKTDGATTWPMVVKQLEPLRSRGWLSYYDNGKIHYGPIIVVGTGNTPYDQVVANSTYRDVFFDAPLDKLRDSSFDETNSYYASVSFSSTIGHVWFGGLSPDQLHKVRRQVHQAHKRGLKARYWNLPAWPINVRNRVWEVLIQEGVDMLNVDDLRGATRVDWDKAWPI